MYSHEFLYIYDYFSHFWNDFLLSSTSHFILQKSFNPCLFISCNVKHSPLSWIKIDFCMLLTSTIERMILMQMALSLNI